jgi:hypothetical protein
MPCVFRRQARGDSDAGGGSPTDQSNKMANTVDINKELQRTICGRMPPWCI